MSDIDEFTQKLDAADHKRIGSHEKTQAEKDAENKKLGLQAGVEFTGSIIVGTAIGVGLDYWLGTKPIFFLSFFFSRFGFSLRRLFLID